MRWKVYFLAAILLLLMVPLARAEEVVSGRALIENSAGFDNKTVIFRGEVIGVMIRGDYAWVNVLDNEGIAIGVWCSAGDAGNISFIGDYGHVGDNVEAVGTFHMACIEHGGDLDIHADNFAVEAVGKELDRPISLPLVALSVALVAVAIFVAFYLRRIRKEREKIVPWPFQ